MLTLSREPRRVVLGIMLLMLAACAAPRAPEGTPPATSRPLRADAPSVPLRRAEPEPFVAASSPADVVAPFVRPERSSRLAVPLPKGRARERWSAALDPKVDPAFVLSAGTRLVVQGRATGAPTARRAAFALLDTSGRLIETGAMDGEALELRPEGGIFFALGGPDAPAARSLASGAPSPEAPKDRREPGVRVASHEGTRATILRGGLEVDTGSGAARSVVEPPPPSGTVVEALDAAIDDAANLYVLVRQDKELALWITTLTGGSVGRLRIEGAAPQPAGRPLRRDRADTPPIIGTTVRVVVLDDRLVAFGRDGRLLWERKGALTGGATLTSDDRLLVASDARVLAIDTAGRATEIASAPKEVFLTAPIITRNGLLVVASGSALHAFAFE